MKDNASDWVCDECAENDPDLYDDGKSFEGQGLVCERCEKSTPRLTQPRHDPEWNLLED